MTKDYPKYIAEIIPSDLTDEMSANRQETLTDFGIAIMNGSKQALTDTQASQATAIAAAIQAKSDLIQKIDDTGTYTYIGKAVPTSLTSAASWQIKRIDINGNILFAEGVTTFTQIWDNRASLSYS